MEIAGLGAGRLTYTASVSLPVNVELKERAARMNAFWRGLGDFQYRDVLVVALCVGEER